MKNNRIKEKTKGKNRAGKSKVASITGMICTVLVLLYLVIMAVVFPFYNSQGYVKIGTDKSMFFRYVGVGFLGIMIPFALVYLICQIRKKGIRELWKEFPDSDKIVVIYLFVTILSFLLSDNKQEAFWGTNGWYIGFVTQVIYVMSYFYISRFFRFDKFIMPLFAIGSGVVFLLGILNRFSIYPFLLQGAVGNEVFISTLGNINWFCGYWSLFFPLSAGFFYVLKTKNEKNIKNFLCRLGSGVYLMLCTVAGAVQGSDSAMLVFTLVPLVLFCLSVNSVAKLKSFYETLIVILASCQLTRILRIVLPNDVNYDSRTTDILTKGNLTFWLLAFILLLYLGLLLLERGRTDLVKMIKAGRRALLLVLATGLLLFVFLLARNTLEPGSIGALSDSSLFTFNSRWGSSRGTTWTAGLRVYADQPLDKKLIGLGPDCFAYGVYMEGSSAEAAVVERFGDSRLTNAHNEWITTLVNMGALGLLSYVGFQIAKAIRYLKYTPMHPLIFACGLALIGYMVHNLFSFQQALNGPFLFILMGIGEAVLGKEKGRESQNG